LTPDEFIGGMSRIKGPAKSIDVMKLIANANQQKALLEVLVSQFSELSKTPGHEATTPHLSSLAGITPRSSEGQLGMDSRTPATRPLHCFAPGRFHSYGKDFNEEVVASQVSEFLQTPHEAPHHLAVAIATTPLPRHETPQEGSQGCCNDANDANDEVVTPEEESQGCQKDADDEAPEAHFSRPPLALNTLGLGRITIHGV